MRWHKHGDISRVAGFWDVVRLHENVVFYGMVIPYQMAKLKSANIFSMAIWDPTTKFNSRQRFWLYGIACYCVYSWLLLNESFTIPLHYTNHNSYQFKLNVIIKGSHDIHVYNINTSQKLTQTRAVDVEHMHFPCACCIQNYNLHNWQKNYRYHC